ncbi:MAG: trimethylamine methyltransferase family protein [Bacillota bacterium]|nr:trimethylamine methyltransferase family protein [Bacillota bacterium]
MRGIPGGRYGPLDEAQVRLIHGAAMEVLETVGVDVPVPDALSLFRARGVRVDGTRVRIPARLVEEALASAPGKVVLAGRDPDWDLVLEDRRVYLGTGGAALTILDLDSGKPRPVLLEDLARLARLVDALPNVHFFLRPADPSDVPQEILDVVKYYVSMQNTTKHVIGSAHDLASARDVAELGSIVAGGWEELRQRPVLSFVCSWMISPLRFSTDVTAVVMEVARMGIPVILSAAPMAGSTSPVTLAGTLVQVHAEELAGITLVQMVNPGAPVIYGAVPSLCNMLTGDYVGGGIEFGMLNAASAQMAHHVGVPVYNSAGLTDAKEPDIQAGYEKAFSLLHSALAGSNLIHHAAGMLESMRAIAYEQYVIDDELISMTLRAVRGIEVSEETMALEVIERVGPGGTHLADPFTARNLRRELFFPSLADRDSRTVWEQGGRLDVRSRAKERVRGIMRDHVVPPLAQEVTAQIRRRHPYLQGM